MLRCEAHYIIDSDWIIAMMGCQHCSISNKRHVSSWVLALSIQMASVNVKESYCVTVVTLQANFPWKITFDMLYTNGFLIKICSRTLSISSEHNTI